MAIRELILATGLIIPISVSAQETLTWPGASPCDTTLQACINAASDEGTVEIATDDPIDEALLVTTSVTLREADGFTATLANDRDLLILNGDPDSITVVVDGLVLTQGRIRALQQSSGAFDVSFRNIMLRDPDDPTAPLSIGRGIPVGPSGDISFEVSDSTFEKTLDDVAGSPEAMLEVGSAGGSLVRGSIVNNSFIMEDSRPTAAIDLTTDERLDIDVIGNLITGSDYRNGVLLVLQADESGVLRVINNTITGQGSTTAFDAAVSLRTANIAVQLELQVLNNKIANNFTGIGLFEGAGVGSTTGSVANNIIAFHSGNGITLEQGTAVQNDFNLVFGNSGDFFEPGPGTIQEDPQFDIVGDLLPTSPARNSGGNSLVPADITTDDRGNPRILGVTVDIGSQELIETCGNLNFVSEGDLDVDATDVQIYRNFLADPIGSPLPESGEDLCNVIGSAGPCSVRDVAVIRRVVEGPALPPGIELVCNGV